MVGVWDDMFCPENVRGSHAVFTSLLQIMNRQHRQQRIPSPVPRPMNAADWKTLVQACTQVQLEMLLMDLVRCVGPGCAPGPTLRTRIVPLEPETRPDGRARRRGRMDTQRGLGRTCPATPAPPTHKPCKIVVACSAFAFRGTLLGATNCHNVALTTPSGAHFGSSNFLKCAPRLFEPGMDTRSTSLSRWGSGLCFVFGLRDGEGG